MRTKQPNKERNITMSDFMLTAPVVRKNTPKFFNLTDAMYDTWTPRRVIVLDDNATAQKTNRTKNVSYPEKAALKHCQQDLLRDVIQSGLHALLVGGAGTGKTQAAENVAVETGLDFYPMSIGEQTTKTDLLGYCSPVTGNYVSTPVRNAFEKGGILLLDEIDAGNANTLTILNALLANGYCSFPDGIIQKHDSFYVVAAANTYGNGADRKYVGRNKLDGAFLDRFVMIDWTLDTELENDIAKGIMPEQSDQVVSYVRAIRRQVEQKHLDVIVSTRSIIATLRLMKNGMPFNEAVKIALLSKLDNKTKSILDIGE